MHSHLLFVEILLSIRQTEEVFYYPNMIYLMGFYTIVYVNEQTEWLTICVNDAQSFLYNLSKAKLFSFLTTTITIKMLSTRLQR